MVKKGIHTSEHWHAVALELLGAGVLLLAHDPLTSAVGAAVLIAGFLGYCFSRGSVKAAAERPRVQHAPPQV